MTSDCSDEVLTRHRSSSVHSDDITKCGLGGWSPSWLQPLASKKVFIMLYGLLGMNELAFASYFIGSISTIEKRFKLPSMTTGLISSSWDLGATFALMIIAYYGGTGHKTRWVAQCSILAGFACYMVYLPQFIFGPGDYSVHGFQNVSNLNKTFCMTTDVSQENCSLNSEGRIAFGILLVAHLLLGVGTSSYYTLGAAYLDDNVMKDKFPFLFAVAACIRYVGPTLGYLISSYALSIYMDPNVTPDFTQKDPRWIGAWYKAWIPFGTVEIILALSIAFFPRVLPREAERRKNSVVATTQNKRKQSLKDFKETIKRLIKNPILMFNTFSATFYLFGLMGYWIFMPKYIETQFRQTASRANLITGSVGLVCTAVGVVASGAVVSRFKPRPRYLAAWNVFTELMDVIGHVLFAYLGCYKADLHGSYNKDGSWELIQSCNSNCSCSVNLQYEPVCSYDKLITFYSPCHAGCLTSELINGTKIFSNCSCIPGLGQAIDGVCPIDCDNQFYIFLTILCVMKFLSSTGRSGNTIIQYRSVAPDDKAISIAFSELIFAVFTFIPSPIIYGLLLDSSCLVWGKTCGKTGNCWLYQGRELRNLLNFTSAGFLFIGALLDFGVIYHVGSLQIYDSNDKEKKQEESEKESERTLMLTLKDNSTNQDDIANSNG